VLSWAPTIGASTYRVTAVSSTGRNIASIDTAATSYAVTGSAPTGTYTWTVTALDNDGKVIGTAQSSFTVDAGIKVVRGVEIQAPTGTGVGATLTSTAPQWDPSDVTTTYQWQRNGSQIFGADGSTYVLRADDFGASISLKVTAKRSGFDDSSATSNVIGVTAGGALQATVPPTITGTAKSGDTLMVGPISWSQPNPILRYQWLRTGAAIPGATTATYQLKPEDAGKDVSVIVLASKTGFADGSAAAPSVAVAKLVSTTSSTLSTTRVKRGKTVKVGVQVTVSGVPTPSGIVKIQDGVKTLKTLTMDPFRKGMMTAKLSTKKLKVGRHKVKLVYLGNASTSGSKAKVIRLIVAKS
jgi:hypothetical protein